MAGSSIGSFGAALVATPDKLRDGGLVPLPACKFL
jgi:hypothetical protein